MDETLDHRERRLGAIGEAVERFLDDGWVYWLVMGTPGESDTINIVSNIHPEQAQEILEAMLKVIKERGESPKEL